VLNDLRVQVPAVVKVFSNLLGVLVVVLGLVYITIELVRGLLDRRLPLNPKTQIKFGKTLVLSMGLTVAADIVGTIGNPSWEEIGKLGAIIGLRTVVNFVLAYEIKQAEGADLTDHTPAGP
jgi:uncharacterized membrane protein